MFTPRPTGRESNRLGAYLLHRYPIDVESTSDWETLPLRSPFGLTAAHSLPKRNMPSFCGLCIARSDHERRRSARELALPSTHLARQLASLVRLLFRSLERCGAVTSPETPSNAPKAPGYAHETAALGQLCTSLDCKTMRILGDYACRATLSNELNKQWIDNIDCRCRH